MKKGDKEMKVWGLIVILMIVVSCVSWAAGSEEAGTYKISAYIEQDRLLFNTTEPNEVANKSICSVFGEGGILHDTHFFRCIFNKKS